MLNKVQTDSGLVRRLKAAAKGPISREERHQQKVSFVYGNLPSDNTMTREQVEKHLRDKEGAE